MDFEKALLFFFPSTKNNTKADWSFRRRRRRRRRRASSPVIDDVFGTVAERVVDGDDDSERRGRVRSRILFFFSVSFKRVRRQSATLRARGPEREKIRE